MHGLVEIMQKNVIQNTAKIKNNAELLFLFFRNGLNN